MGRIAGLVCQNQPDVTQNILEEMAISLMPKACGHVSLRVTSSDVSGTQADMVGLASVESVLSGTEVEKSPLGDDVDPVFAVIDGTIHNCQDLIIGLGLGLNEPVPTDDSSLLVQGYLKQGLEFFQRINGEFACLLYDREQSLWHCVRDRFGTHLLFYSWMGKSMTIASEIKAIFANPDVCPQPNLETVYRYVFSHYRYVYGTEETFFAGIKIIPPNTIWTLSLRDGRASQQPLWRFECDDYSAITDEEAAERFHNLLEGSMKLRLDPVREPRTFLISGGLDSPTIAVLAAQRLRTTVSGFSICYENERTPKGELRYDERDFIRPTIEMYGMDWFPVFPSPSEFSGVFEEMLQRHDEPISSPTWYSHYQLTRQIAASGYKVVFGGDGGDHALAGLYDDFPYYFADLKQHGDTARLERELSCWQELHDHPVFSKNRQVWELYSQRCFDWNQPGKIIGYTWDEGSMRGLGQYNQVVHNDFKRYSTPLPLFPSISKRYLISKLYQDLLYTSSPPSSREEDINFTTFGLSIRSVFLDPEFMKFCWSLPGHLMIRDGMSKYLIRYAMRENLPETVRTKKEHVGLNAPANLWFRGPLRGLIIETVDSPVWDKFQLFKRNQLKAVLNSHLEGKADHMMFLWKVFSLSKWLERWKFL